VEAVPPTTSLGCTERFVRTVGMMVSVVVTDAVPEVAVIVTTAWLATARVTTLNVA
jgi:hypothetical protein